MNEAEITECLRLLDAADQLLIASDELVLAAHLSAVMEPIRQRRREADSGALKSVTP